MDRFITDVSKKTRKKLNQLNLIEVHPSTIDVSQWKRFRLYDFFDIEAGTKLDKVKMKDTKPTIDFVGRANTNNGVTTRVDEIKGIKPYDSGNMTLALGGEYLGSCFIQNNPFYTSQNVVVLIPKKKMSEDVKLFVATCIFKESRLHYKAFVDELNRHIKRDFSFPLPVDVEGAPDFKYMEKYIKKIRIREEKKYKYKLVEGLEKQCR